MTIQEVKQNLEQDKVFKRRPGGPSFARRVGKGFNQTHRDFLNDNANYLINTEFNKVTPDIILEIGSGDGYNAINLCQYYPHHTVIAAEVFLSGVVQTIKKAVEQKIDNLKIFADDINLLISKFSDQTITDIYILFPDPWPKNKQHKRRLVQTNFIESLLPKLKNDGQIIIATDHPDYAKWINKHLEAVKNIEFQVTTQAPSYYTPTKYHHKDLAGHSQVSWFYVEKRLK